MKNTINPIMRIKTEFITLPPCGERFAYEILMNSPRSVPSFFDALPPPLISSDLK